MTLFDEKTETPARAGFAALLNRHRLLLGTASAIVLLIAAFLLGRASHPAGDPGHGHEAGPQAGEKAGTAAATVYTCSMHPQVRTTDPKAKCPICGMDLVPVTRGEDDGDPSVPRLSVSPRSAALMQVETAPVERRAVSASILLYGKVDVDETRLRHIAAWVPGRLEKLFVDTTGVEVRAGQPMVLVYSPPLVAAQQELVQSLEAVRRLPEGAAPSHRAGAQALAAAARDKLTLLGLDEALVEEIARNGRVADRLTLTSPVDGVVTARDATEGMYVETGQRIYSLADLSHVWVQLEAHERDLPWLRVGQPVTFSVRALPGESFRGTVAFIQPTVGEATRTVQVRVNVPNPGRRLKPGMFVTGEVQAPREGAAPLVVPASAPLVTGRRAVVYVQVEGKTPTFEGREVVLGPKAGDHYVVLEGLAEGDLVVTRGAFKIDSELQIRARPSMMTSGGGTPSGHAHGEGAPAPAPAAPAAALPVVSAAPATVPAGKPAPASIPPAFGEQIAGVLKANFALVKGLSDDDPAASRRAAEDARAAVAKVDASLLPAAARDLWRPLAARMERGLAALLPLKELDDMRPHFEVFSDALTEAVRRFGTGSVGPVYRAMCPMVQDRKAYWLQATEPITNPYHGDRMYSCGSIAETLATAGAAGERRP
jgi:Cu(I)/Ag(I) efflux system membrane fusion protein